MVCHLRRWLALATVNLSTKFEVSISINYEVMKGDKNVENGVIWGSLKVTGRIEPFDREYANSFPVSIL